MKEKRIIYLIMGVSSILILLIGITTAWFEWKSEIDTNVTFNVSGLNITYEGEPTVIKGNLYPTMYMNNTDNIIHNFSLVTTSNIEIYSKISLEIITLPDELKHESFRWNLYKDSTQISSGSFQNATVGTDLLLTPYETITTTKSNYTLYIWIDGEHYDNPLTMGGKTFEFKLKLEASQQIYDTAEECFEFDENTQTITKYLCNGGGTVTKASYSVDEIKRPSSKYMSLSKAITIDTTTTQSYPLITDVVIPKTINDVTVKHIGDESFATCGKGPLLTSYEENDNNISIMPFNNDKNIVMDKIEYSGCRLTSVVIPDSVTTIGESAFRANNLTSVVIPDSVTTIEYSAFSYNNLTSVTIGNSVTTIGKQAFESNNLTSVVIPDSVTTIGNYAFQYNNLSSVYIGANSNLTETTGIGMNAFRSNGDLSVIYNYSGKVFNFGAALGGGSDVIVEYGTVDGVKIISSNSCFEFDVSTGTITDYVVSVGSYDIHPQCVANAQTNLEITEEEATTVCSGGEFRGYTIDGYILLGASAELESAGIITNVVYDTSVVIPSSINGVPVTTIGNYAFSLNNLTSVTIPNSVTTIGGGAFYSNNLTSVVIPDSVTTIGDGAFSLNNLTSVVIPNSVTTIGNYAFGANNLTSVVIPNSVTTIGGGAFTGNNLSSVYIGANSNLTETTGIGMGAFSSSNRTNTSNGTTYVDNPNLTIYNNSGKKFKWYYVTQERNDSTEDAYNFITGTVPSYTSGSTTYNSVTITTGGNP